MKPFKDFINQYTEDEWADIYDDVIKQYETNEHVTINDIPIVCHALCLKQLSLYHQWLSENLSE